MTVIAGAERVFAVAPSTDIRNFDYIWTPPDSIEVAQSNGTRKIRPAGADLGHGLTAPPPSNIIKILDRRTTRLDQGDSSACAYFGQLNGAKSTRGQAVTNEQGLAGYKRAQELDEWAGSETADPRYEGTSCNGALKAAREAGIVESWWWCTRVEDVINAVLFGNAVSWPAVWTSGMVWPNASNIMSASGAEVGGHLSSIYAWIGPWGLVGIDNSWGPDFGHDGASWFPWAELVRKWAEWPEAAVPVFVSP